MRGATRSWDGARRRRPAPAAVVVVVAVAITAAGCRRDHEAAAAALGGAPALVLGGQSVSAERIGRGAAAYTHYCRACHGAAGDGAGTAAPGLRPPPRDLRLGVYKFGAVAAGQLPTDADFRRIIAGGLHGTAMLPWQMPEPELDDVIQYIKTFAPRWRTEQPGEPIVPSPDPWPAMPGGTGAAVERGRRVYHGLAQCAVACHPAYVTRREIFEFSRALTGMYVTEMRPDLYAPVPKPSDYGTTIVPPDFTFHVLRSSDAPADIYRSIAAGIGGTAMPTWKNVLPEPDLWALAHYVRSLVALRDTPAADALGKRLADQPPWTPPPPPAPAPPDTAAPDKRR